MRQCDALFGRDTQHAEECREGARDAHLLDYTFGRPEAYTAGRTATLACPPTFDDAYPYPRRYATNAHDPRSCNAAPWDCMRNTRGWLWW